MNQRWLWGLLAAAHALTIGYITFEATHAIDGRDNGRLAGDQALLLAAVWALYGLALALAERRFAHLYVRQAARLLLGAGLAFLAGGALLSNARWADPVYRFGAYGAVLGATWLSEWLFARAGRDGDVQGIASLVALGVGALAVSFELRLWLDRVYTFPPGTLRGPESLAMEASVRTFWTVAGWGLYALAAMAAGVLVRSGRARLVACGLFGLALGYALVGAPHAVAPLPLQLGALAVAAGGAGLGAWLMGRAAGERHPREALAAWALGWGAVALVVLWAVFHIIKL